METEQTKAARTEVWQRRQVDDNRIEIDLTELFALCVENIRVIVAFTILGGILVGAISFFLITPKYTASAQMYMVSSSEGSVVDLSTLNMGTSLAADYEELIRIYDISAKVIETLGLDYTVEELGKMITITNPTSTRVLYITVESTDPTEAMNIANSIADVSQKLLPSKTDTLKPRIVQAAIMPEKKSSPHNARNTLIGAAVGFVLALGFYTVLLVTDTTLHTDEDVEKAFNMMPLAVVPEGNTASISDKKEASDMRRLKKERKRREREKKKNG